MLNIQNVTKQYNKQNGIYNINLQCLPSNVYAIIGPNGAGKTTLITSIAGLLPVDSGSITINNCPTFLRECKKYIGYAMGDDFIYPNMSIEELLHMVCEIKYNRAYFEQIEPLLKDFKLYSHRHKLLRSCSQGMKKKTGLAMSFLGYPNVILLDEPTNGVDTEGIITLKDYIQQAKTHGSTILVTSHVLDFVGSISDTCIFIKDGHIVKIMESNGTLEDEYKKIYFNHLY